MFFKIGLTCSVNKVRTKLYDALENAGVLTTATGEDGKASKDITSKSAGLGIFKAEAMGQGGKRYFGICLSPKGQRFVLNEILPEINMKEEDENEPEG